MLKQLLYSIIILGSLSLFADEVGTSNTHLVDEQKELQINKVKLEASLSNLQYFTSVPSENSTQQKGQIEVEIQKPDFFNYKIHGLAGTFSTPKSSYFALPEAYVGYSEVDNLNFVAIGRKKELFSFADHQQNLGLFNPYFSNDLIDYREEGLVGAHFGAHTSNFGFHAGYYPFYIPNQGPQVYAEDGEIKSANRWAKKPPTEFSFASQNHEIVYAIRDYSLNEVVNHGGYAAAVFVGENAQRPLVQVSYSRKPISEIPLSRDTYGTAADFVGQVKLSPVVEYTKIGAIDFNLDGTLFKTTFSYIEDHPENGVAAVNETLQFLEPLKIYSVWFSSDLTNALDRNLVVELGYSEIVDGQIRDLQSDGSPSIFTFSNQRTLFKKPMTVSVKTDLAILKKKPILATVKWTYDRAIKGSLLSGLVAYEAFNKVNLNLGFDILGVENDSGDSSFLKDNEANDRVYGGLQYAF